MGEKVRELRSTDWLVQNSQGDIKNSTGNGVANKCVTHGHELRRELPEGMGVTGWRGAKGKIGTTAIA